MHLHPIFAEGLACMQNVYQRLERNRNINIQFIAKVKRGFQLKYQSNPSHISNSFNVFNRFWIDYSRNDSWISKFQIPNCITKVYESVKCKWFDLTVAEIVAGLCNGMCCHLFNWKMSDSSTVCPCIRLVYRVIHLEFVPYAPFEWVSRWL